MTETLRIDGAVLISSGTGMAQTALTFTSPTHLLDSCGSASVADSAEQSEQTAAMASLHLGDRTHGQGMSLIGLGSRFEAADLGLTLGGGR